jgi:hypothetical protein
MPTVVGNVQGDGFVCSPVEIVLDEDGSHITKSIGIKHNTLDIFFRRVAKVIPVGGAVERSIWLSSVGDSSEFQR